MPSTDRRLEKTSMAQTVWQPVAYRWRWVSYDVKIDL